MANELRFLDDKLLFDGDKLAMSSGCCCGCCDDIGGPPTADFSYNQTDDSPCTLDLYDESTNGTCGTINQWRWYKNGVLISTSQNPTGITYTDGDDITLEVEATTGCTDSAVMEVDCIALSDCSECPDGFPPATLSVVLTGLGGPPGHNCHCADVEGEVFHLPHLASCTWEYNNFSDNRTCADFGATSYRVFVTLQLSGSPTREITVGVRVYVPFIDTWWGATFEKSYDSDLPCSGTHVLPYVSTYGGTGGTFPCGTTGVTCTVTIP